jgi:hypothetical protein
MMALLTTSLYPFITLLTADPFIRKYLPMSFAFLTAQYSNPPQWNFEGLTPKPLAVSNIESVSPLCQY